MRHSTREKLFKTMLNERHSLKSDSSRTFSQSSGFSNWKRQESAKGVNDALNKLMISSILHNLEKEHYLETLKDLKKYFVDLNDTPGNISNKKCNPPSINLILFDLFSSLLNWRHNNFNLFYEILHKVIIKISVPNFEKENGKFYIDDNLMTLLKNFITINYINFINQNYDNAFELTNLKKLLNHNKHTIKMVIILIMVFFTIIHITQLENNQIEINKDEICASLNNVLKKNICRESKCLICSKEYIIKLNKYVGDFSVPIEDHLKLLFERKKSLSDYIDINNSNKTKNIKRSPELTKNVN